MYNLDPYNIFVAIAGYLLGYLLKTGFVVQGHI